MILNFREDGRPNTTWISLGSSDSRIAAKSSRSKSPMYSPHDRPLAFR